VLLFCCGCCALQHCVVVVLLWVLCVVPYSTVLLLFCCRCCVLQYCVVVLLWIFCLVSYSTVFLFCCGCSVLCLIALCCCFVVDVLYCALQHCVAFVVGVVNVLSCALHNCVVVVVDIVLCVTEMCCCC
jgi:hypothetical protein